MFPNWVKKEEFEKFEKEMFERLGVMEESINSLDRYFNGRITSFRTEIEQRIDNFERAVLQTLEKKFSEKFEEKKQEWDWQVVHFISDAQAEFSSLKNDYFKTRKKINELYDALENNGDEILRSRLKQYGKKLDSANAKIKKLEVRVKQLEQENKRLKEENAELREFVEASLREMMDMKRQIELLVRGHEP